MKDNPAKNSSLETLIAQCREGFPQKSLYILELPVFFSENGFPFFETNILPSREFQGGVNYEAAEEGARAQNCRDYEKISRAGALNTTIKTAQNFEPDILGLKFNIEAENEIEKAVGMLGEILPEIKLPLMLRGTGNDEIDSRLLPKLADFAKNAGRQCIIAAANENTYKKIIPHTAQNHYVVLRSPIDINLAKEINILSSDLGQPLDRILIDTDIGGLGYGFEYGYSIIEKIRQEGADDKFLEMPVISFACEEALKTKEAKSDNFSQSWGDLKTRAIMFETAAASAIRAAGANLIVINNPQTLETMKGLE